jgi:hypothetical protein
MSHRGFLHSASEAAPRAADWFLGRGASVLVAGEVSAIAFRSAMFFLNRNQSIPAATPAYTGSR